MFGNNRNRMDNMNMDNHRKIYLLEKAKKELLDLESKITNIQNRYILKSLNVFERRDILNDIGDIGSIITDLTSIKIPEIITKLERNQYDNRGNLFGYNGMAVVNQYGRNGGNYIGNNGGNMYNINFRNSPRDLNNFVNNGYNRYNYYNRGNNGFW